MTDPTRPARQDHHFRLGVAVGWHREAGRLTRRDECRFTEPAAFWAWLSGRAQSRKALYVWAHNLAFDLLALRYWESLERGQFTLRAPPARSKRAAGSTETKKVRQGVVCTEDPPTIVECWDEQGRKVVLLDSLNWFRCRLEDLAPEVGLAKVPLPDWSAPDAAWWERCEADALILERTVNELLDWLRACKAGNFRYTLSGQAMASWRHGCGGPPVSVGDDLPAKEWERGSLYFARQWCHWVGVVDDRALGPFTTDDGARQYPLAHRQGPLHVLDVRGCYPHVMRDRLYPREHIATEDGATVDKLLRRLGTLGAIADVEVQSELEPYPLRRGGRVWWCLGRYWTRLAGPELTEAVHAGHVVAVGRVHWYSMADLFTAWVHHWWMERGRQELAGRPVWARCTKGILNGLHGKFGERAHQWTGSPGTGSAQPWGHFFGPGSPGQPPLVYRALAGHVQRRGDRGETPGGMPAVTAWVHSAARLHVRRLAHVAGDDGLIWIDCDQLCVDDVGLARLRAHPGLVGDGLGQLAHQWSEASGCVEGVRSYQLGGRVVRQGISRSARQLADGSWEQEDWQRLDHLLGGRPPPGPVVTKVVKSAPACSVGGKLTAGGTYRPWRVEEIPDG